MGFPAVELHVEEMVFANAVASGLCIDTLIRAFWLDLGALLDLIHAGPVRFGWIGGPSQR